MKIDPKIYQYVVLLNIDVKRTDNLMLTDKENIMVLKMKFAAEKAMAKVMEDYGQGNRKDLGSEMRVY